MMQFNQFCFDSRRNRLTRQGEDVYLRQKLIQLLSYLLANSDRVISKEELLREIWQHGEYRERSLAQSILELRKALGDSASSPQYIRTIPHHGYQWICLVTELPQRSDNTDENSVGALEADSQLVKANEYHILQPKKDIRDFARKTILLGFLPVLSVVLIVIYSVFWESPSELNSHSTGDPSEQKVLILPFENHTHTSSMQWVEYGLSDMLAGDLMTVPWLQVYSPAQSVRLLASKNTLPENLIFGTNEAQLRKILFDHDADSLIVARVRLETDQQVLDYRIINRSTEEQQTGTLNYHDLAVSMPAIACHIYQQLIPEPIPVKLPEYGYKPSAMHDYARGIQALQLTGPSLAQHYFAASVQIDPEHYWSKAYLAVCMILLGEYDQSESMLNALHEISEDQALKGFIQLWLSQLWLRQGEISKAGELLSIESQQPLTAGALRQRIQAQLQQLNNHRLLSPSQAGSQYFWYMNSLLPELMDFDYDKAQQRSFSEDLLRQLNVLGQKPALMTGLLVISSDLQRPALIRENYLNKALEHATTLQQPYEQALIRFLRAKLIAEQSSDSSLPENARQDLQVALEITAKLETKLLHQAIQQFLEKDY